MRELAAEGKRDDEIAATLNAEDIPTGMGGPKLVPGQPRRWTALGVAWVRRREGIALTGPRRPAIPPMPDRDQKGRYSIRGAARRFGVTLRAVHNWIERGLVSGQREPFGPFPLVWWLEIDDEKVAQLEAHFNRKGRT